jgi:DNA-binding CsgD family transcriptional regulator
LPGSARRSTGSLPKLDWRWKCTGYTLTEIAGRLNVSVPTAHRMIRDALVEIASRLGPAPND